jgi:phage-related protein
MDTFTWIPLGTVKPKTQALNRRLEFEAGNEQVQRISVNSKTTWELPIEGVKSTLDELQAFFDAHAPGGITFYYTDFNKVKHTVRFATDSLEPTDKLGFGDDGVYGVQGFSVTVTLRKVWPTT